MAMRKNCKLKILHFCDWAFSSLHPRCLFTLWYYIFNFIAFIQVNNSSWITSLFTWKIVKGKMLPLPLKVYDLTQWVYLSIVRISRHHRSGGVHSSAKKVLLRIPLVTVLWTAKQMHDLHLNHLFGIMKKNLMRKPNYRI